MDALKTRILQSLQDLRVPQEGPVDLGGKALRAALATSFLSLLLGVGLFVLAKPDPLFTMTRPRYDFHCYYWWSQAYARGLHPAEGPKLAIKETGDIAFYWAFYPPSLLEYMRPLMGLTERNAQLVFYSLMVVGLGLYNAACGVLSGYPVLGTLLFAAWGGPAFLHAANLGQPTPITAAFFAFSLLLLARGRWAASGLLMAIPTFFKPLELMLWVPIAIVRDRRAVLVFGGACVAMLAFFLALQGTTLWVEWVYGMPKTGEHRLLMPRHYAFTLGAVLALAGSGAMRERRREA